MTKTRMNFRLSELACKRLAELSIEWGLNATQVIERLLMDRGDSQLVDAISPTFDRGPARGKIEVQREARTSPPPSGKPNVRRVSIPKPDWKA